MISQELAEYASTHAGGSHNLQQQLKQGLFTRNPRLFETAAYAFFVGREPRFLVISGILEWNCVLHLPPGSRTFVQFGSTFLCKLTF